MALVRLKDFNIDNSGNVLVTNKIQEVLDNNKGNTIIFDEGKYLVSSLFIKSDTKIIFENAYLIATTEETEYPVLDTRVAGIEMPWYVGVLNIIDQTNVEISGNGTIDGSGPYWWNKYWGNDMHGGMRAKYDKLGLRFACDYDCRRIRNLVVSNSSNIKISDIADEFGYNPKYLSHLFVEIRNIPLKQFIISQKMDAANFMLADNDKTVSQIASDLGFSDVHNFARAYKKYTGLTPSEYRNAFAKRMLFHI